MRILGDNFLHRDNIYKLFLEKRRCFNVGSPDKNDEAFRNREQTESSETDADILDFSAEQHQTTVLDKILAVHERYAIINGAQREGSGISGRFSQQARSEKIIEGVVKKQEELNSGIWNSEWQRTKSKYLWMNDGVGREFQRQKLKLEAVRSTKVDMKILRDKKIKNLEALRIPKKRSWLGSMKTGWENLKEAKRAVSRFSKGRLGVTTEDQKDLGFVHEKQFQNTESSLNSIEKKTLERVKEFEAKFKDATKNDIPVKKALQSNLDFKSEKDLDDALGKHFETERGQPPQDEKALDLWKSKKEEKKEWQNLGKQGKLLSHFKELKAEEKGESNPSQKKLLQEKLKRLEDSIELKAFKALDGNAEDFSSAFDRINSLSRASQIQLQVEAKVKQRNISNEILGSSGRISALRESILNGKIKPRMMLNLEWRTKPLINKWNDNAMQLFSHKNKFQVQKIEGSIQNPELIRLLHANTSNSLDATIGINLKTGEVELQRWIKIEEDGTKVEISKQESDDITKNIEKAKQDKMPPPKYTTRQDTQKFSLRILDKITPLDQAA